ncbi:hypothetical protein A3A55_03395 [Candidatus Roizmanbacteria bacterium RIFCSPLOWO2_01_FULL_40_14]|nr:MAG: hypothetical protein A3A55_03395 [Candidatus Roizmanbacteria bacterium RIFCSPLOWO2_01_FULL_40_14]
MFILYVFILCILTLYSYALVDPNLTLINNSYWVTFREVVIQLGYYQRDTSWFIYLFLIISLFIFSYLFIRKYNTVDPFKIALIVSGILLFSYPFLSHDFFNYIFDAKIFTYYHQNPYLKTPLDFPKDEWLRFMHWVHRSYPYGPTFLPLTIIPSFFAVGKFILNYVFFKILFALSYLLGVFYLQKIDKKSAFIFATHPLVIVEGLVNAHNDLIGVSLAIAGFYYLSQKKEWVGRGLMLMSGGIKYITIPLVIWQKKKTHWLNYAVISVVIGMIIYLSLFLEIQTWYFLTLFVFLPVYRSAIDKIQIFLFGLLMSYYPYIRLGGWDTDEKMALKHWIIISAVILNIAYLLFYKRFYSLFKK